MRGILREVAGGEEGEEGVVGRAIERLAGKEGRAVIEDVGRFCRGRGTVARIGRGAEDDDAAAYS